MIYLRYFLICISIFLPWLASAQDFSVTAKLDSAQILMGYTTRLRLSVNQPASAKVSFPMLKSVGADDIIPLCGDSVEMSGTYTLDTVRLSNSRIRVNYNMRIQSFDSGRYVLPRFDFASDRGVVKSNSVILSVIPVKVAEDAQITGFTSVAEPDEATLKGPDSKFIAWLKKFWYIFPIIILIAVATIWAWRRYRRVGSLLPVKPVIPPYDEAMGALKNLEARGLWQQGKEKAYYTGLTLILRRYLSKEWNIQAMEMTSGQIMRALKSSELRDLRAPIRRILDMADFAKFAKVRPLPQDNTESFDNCRDFIIKAHQLYVEKQACLDADDSKSDDAVSDSYKSKASKNVASKMKIRVSKKNNRRKGGKRYDS
ncbi:MAG: hypothetical protein NC036_06695 [Muribaculaceae bacterium]|nr:hypothetical protein [Muribaculaceae bacterium]